MNHSMNLVPLPNRIDFHESSGNYYSPFRGLFILEDIFQNALTESSPQCDTPPEVKIPLRLHQKAMLYAMEQMEESGTKGRKVLNETLFTNIGVLGDRVGVGKSLMVLSHIAHMKNKTNITYNTTTATNSSSLFSIKQHTVSDNTSSNLIIIPHNLFRQWQEYIETQTSLKACFIKSKTLFATETALAKEVLAADFTLVSNTLFNPFMQFCHNEKVEWKRVFIDEADSIHITSTTPRIKAGFIWFITASWANILFFRDVRFGTSHVNIAKAHAFHPEVLQWLDREMCHSTHGNLNLYYGTYYNMRSYNYFKDLISLHPLRGNILLTNSREFLESSIKMPLIKEQIITCLPSAASTILGNLINENVRALLHAGDVKGALQAIGVNESDNMSLIQAVNMTRQKELDNYRKTLAFKETLEYSTTGAKEHALKNLRDKIHSLEDQIKTLKERLQNVSQELCGICYEEPEPMTMTPCCNQIFCGRCLLLSLEKNPECPMCRQAISGKNIIVIGKDVSPKMEIDTDEVKPLKKHDALLKLIRENPNGKFLVFSRYDNPFEQINASCLAEGITIRQVKGNKDVINATLNSFEKGDTRVLYLNSAYSGAGLSIISATHVVLLHAMASEEQKQIVGRAYRLGRTAELNLVRLLHPGEA